MPSSADSTRTTLPNTHNIPSVNSPEWIEHILNSLSLCPGYAATRIALIKHCLFAWRDKHHRKDLKKIVALAEIENLGVDTFRA